MSYCELSHLRSPWEMLDGRLCIASQSNSLSPRSAPSLGPARHLTLGALT